MKENFKKGFGIMMGLFVGLMVSDQLAGYYKKLTTPVAKTEEVEKDNSAL